MVVFTRIQKLRGWRFFLCTVIFPKCPNSAWHISAQLTFPEIGNPGRIPVLGWRWFIWFQTCWVWSIFCNVYWGDGKWPVGYKGVELGGKLYACYLKICHMCRAVNWCHLCGWHCLERVNVKQEFTEKEGMTREVGEWEVRGRKCLKKIGMAKNSISQMILRCHYKGDWKMSFLYGGRW